MRILVTGAGGFVGSHLTDLLLTQVDAEVWGTRHPTSQQQYINNQVQSVAVDLCDPTATTQVLEAVRPERIYHLAGQAFVPASWTDPWDTLTTNIRSQLNILQGCIDCGLKTTKVLVIGSQEEYGKLEPEHLPASETTSLQPDNPYGVSKVAQDLLGQAYYLRYQLPVVRVRPFNHIGPRQNQRFVAADFAGQIAAIERQARPPVIRVGNLAAERDFTDVRDVARAYLAALERGVPGEVYVVASGVVRSVRAILDGLLAHSSCAVAVEIDPTRFRPLDSLIQKGDSTKLREATGWQPQIPFEQTLGDILNYERQTYS